MSGLKRQSGPGARGDQMERRDETAPPPVGTAVKDMVAATAEI